MNDEKGYALIIVLWIIVIVGVIFANLADETNINNLLTRNDLKRREVRNAALSGLMYGIDTLKEEIDYSDIEGMIVKELDFEFGSDIDCQVEVEEIGSRLNLNYDPYRILSSLKWWSKDLTEEIEKSDLFPNLSFAKEIIEENYDKDYKKFSFDLVPKEVITYGNFNVNYSRLDSLEKLLELRDVDESQRDIIIQELTRLRREDKVIKLVDELPNLIAGLDMTSFDKIKPYLSTEGRININLVSKELLDVLIERILISRDKDSKSSSRYTSLIVNYRDNYQIKDFKQLQNHLNIFRGEEFDLLNVYFSTYSKYFSIKVKSLSKEMKIQKNLKIIVKRLKTNRDSYKIKIINWAES
ncbi:general secretion pathway protein K [Orenia metallireducens]|uniref:General secretion pathway protein K n=1 Tax=Orenia metallireducens TaxID=1413210 RepID=A0A285GGY5_9FIRM|nr:general secretion pathway protein GspK [Orenia metallireducens]PRX30493.1 general secretion pathway protein K [Orenia metallireducens]SNY22860.1 general secretion pathway protein K [Orenia metallireducens]